MEQEEQQVASASSAGASKAAQQSAELFSNTVAVQSTRSFTYEERQEIADRYRSSFFHTHITPYDRTISVSGLQLREADFPYLKQYQEIIIANYPNNPFIKLLKAFQKDNNKLIKKISKVAKDQGKSVYEAILDYVNQADRTKSFSDHVSEIFKIPSSLGNDQSYSFYALVFCSKIINTLISFGIEPEFVLFNTLAQNMIDTRSLQALASKFIEKKGSDIEVVRGLNQAAFRHLVKGEEEEVISLFRNNPELLNDDKIAKLDTAVRYGRVKIVEYMLDSVDLKTINNELYIGLYNSVIQSIIRGHPQICLQFIAPRIWNIFNEVAQIQFFKLIVLRSGEDTREILIDNLIENKLFTYCLFIQVMNDNSHSAEKLKEISESLNKYQALMMYTMLKTVIDAAHKKPENLDVTVLKISGVVALTKYFTKASKQQAIKDMYEKLRPFLEKLKEEYAKLDESKNKHHHIFLGLMLKIDQENTKKIEDERAAEEKAAAKALAQHAEEMKKISEEIDMLARKVAQIVAGAAAISEEKDDDKESELSTAASGDDHPDDDKGGEKLLVVEAARIQEEVLLTAQQSSSSTAAQEETSAEVMISSAIDVQDLADQRDKKTEKLPIKLKPQPLQKSWTSVVKANIPVEPRLATTVKPKPDAVVVVGEEAKVKEAILPEVLPTPTETANIAAHEDKQPAAGASADIVIARGSVNLGGYALSDDQIRELSSIRFGSFGDDSEPMERQTQDNFEVQTDDEIPHITFGNFELDEFHLREDSSEGNQDDDLSSGYENEGENSDDAEAGAVLQSGSNNEAAGSLLSVAPQVLSLINPNDLQVVNPSSEQHNDVNHVRIYPAASSKTIPVAQIINLLHIYQNYIITTQWYVTSSAKLIYSLIIARPNGLVNYYFDLKIGGLTQLSKEEYNSLKPSDISTSNHQIIGDGYVFTVVELDNAGMPIFQYTLNFPYNFIQITNVYNIPIAEGTQQSQALSESSAAQNNDSGAAAAAMSANGNSSSGSQNGSTNLSNQATQTNSTILENFKENEPKTSEFTISTIVSLDDLDTKDEQNKEYQEQKEEVERRLEEQYSVKVRVEGFNDKVNVTDYNPEIDASALLKPLSGEHDFGFKFFGSYSA